MKRKIIFILALFFLMPVVSAKVTVHLFHSSTCPHCKSEINYLKTLDNIDVKYYEVNEESDLFQNLRNKLGIVDPYVPVTVIGSDYFIGYSENSKYILRDMLKAYEGKDYCDVVNATIENKDVEACKNQNKGIYVPSDEKVISIFGKNIKFNIKSVSLPLISILIGFIDGFNPCAMWVLIFLISMLFNMKNRKKMWTLGVTFLMTSALVYLVFMLGILSISNIIGNYFKYIISIVAIVGGIINLNSFRKSLKKDDGCAVTNKEDRKKIINKIKNIVNENNFLLAMLGIILLAISVNFVELACSAGLPTLFVEILSLNNLDSLHYSIYMLLYIFMFMLDDLIIFIISMVTLKATGISNKYTKYSHLVGGIIMLIIGLLMIFKTNWLMFNF